jgi:hypothetical protein
MQNIHFMFLLLNLQLKYHQIYLKTQINFNFVIFLIKF